MQCHSHKCAVFPNTTDVIACSSPIISLGYRNQTRPIPHHFPTSLLVAATFWVKVADDIRHERFQSCGLTAANFTHPENADANCLSIGHKTETLQTQAGSWT